MKERSSIDYLPYHIGYGHENRLSACGDAQAGINKMKIPIQLNYEDTTPFPRLHLEKLALKGS
ncbi:MAG: hypothetical protein NUV74_02400 [Candidatus Brocadiaceae bacterium]|nr:hypothetical protein [Candidatus Brocadiaceae bacterium]